MHNDRGISYIVKFITEYQGWILDKDLPEGEILYTHTSFDDWYIGMKFTDRFDNIVEIIGEKDEVSD